MKTRYAKKKLPTKIKTRSLKTWNVIRKYTSAKISFNAIDAMTMVLMFVLFLLMLPSKTTVETKVRAPKTIKFRKIPICDLGANCNTGYIPTRNKTRQNKKYFLKKSASIGFFRLLFLA